MSLRVVIFVLLTILAQVATLIRSGDQINLAMISIWNIWNCADEKTLYRTFEAQLIDFLFLLDPDGSVSNIKSITTRPPPAEIMHKRSRTDNAIKLPVGKQ